MGMQPEECNDNDVHAFMIVILIKLFNMDRYDDRYDDRRIIKEARSLVYGSFQ